MKYQSISLLLKLIPIHIIISYFYFKFKCITIKKVYEGHSLHVFINLFYQFQIMEKYHLINITYSFDTQWHLYAIVSITSLMENSCNTSIWYNIYIIVPPDFNSMAKERLYSLAKKYNRLSIFIIPIIKELQNFRPYKNAKSVAYRLFLPEILPNIQKIIHLDVDTFIFSDLDEMYSLNMTNLEFRGIIDFDWYKDLQKLNVTDNDHYINAGVLLINLDELRKDHFLNKTKDFLSKYGRMIILADQTIINVLSYKKNDFLPLQFGFHNWYCSNKSYEKFFKSPIFYKYYSKKEVLNIISNLTIVHYMKKPWNYKGESPYSSEWGKMALKTDYAFEIMKTCKFKIWHLNSINGIFIQFKVLLQTITILIDCIFLFVLFNYFLGLFNQST